MPRDLLFQVRLKLTGIFLIIGLWMFGSIISQAQNLLPNHSFEDFNICEEYNEKCAPAAWRSTGLKLPKFVIGLKDRKISEQVLGTNFIDLLVYDAARLYDRRFIQTPLLEPLEPGAQYEFSLFIKSNDFKTVKSIGVYFSNALHFEKDQSVLAKISPQLRLMLPKEMKPGQWIQVTGMYQAAGAESHLMIGNFLTDDNLEWLIMDEKLAKKKEKQKKKVYQPQSRVYLSIDQICLKDQKENPTKDFSDRLQIIYSDTYRHSLFAKSRKLNAPNAELKVLKEKSEHLKREVSEPEKEHSFDVEKVFRLEGILFETAKADLKAGAVQRLDGLAIFLQGRPELKIRIVGHTDNRGSQLFNQQLSRQRAEAVYAYLYQVGIHTTRMQFSGKGAIAPIADNHTLEGRAQNRRVEISFFEGR